MIGQYTYDELIEKGHIVSSIEQYHIGLIVRHVGSTYNYYHIESDGTWTNYKCRTVPTNKYIMGY